MVVRKLFFIIFGPRAKKPKKCRVNNSPFSEERLETTNSIKTSPAKNRSLVIIGRYRILGFNFSAIIDKKICVVVYRIELCNTK